MAEMYYTKYGMSRRTRGALAGQPLDDLTFGASSPAHRCKERTQEGAEDGSGETGVERQQVTQADRQRQHPLADGDPWQDPVHQVGRRIRHAAPQARRTEAAAFSRERDQPVGSAPVAMHPDEPVPEVAADQEGAELAFDERRQRPVPIAGLLEEPVQSLCDDAVQGGGLGVPRYVDGLGDRSRPGGKRVTSSYPRCGPGTGDHLGSGCSPATLPFRYGIGASIHVDGPHDVVRDDALRIPITELTLRSPICRRSLLNGGAMSGGSTGSQTTSTRPGTSADAASISSSAEAPHANRSRRRQRGEDAHLARVGIERRAKRGKRVRAQRSERRLPGGNLP